MEIGNDKIIHLTRAEIYVLLKLISGELGMYDKHHKTLEKIKNKLKK